MEIAKWNITKILQRAQIVSTNYIYKYNQMPCINSKPVLQVGNEELLSYKINIPLHFSFCNPKSILKTLKEQAETKEPFDWIYQKEYKGSFIIENIEENIEKQVNDVILYANISLNLLEYPTDEEYKEQKENKVDLEKYEQYSEDSSKLKNFAKTIKNSITNNLKDAILNPTLSTDLSQRAKEIYSSVANGVISDISNDNLIDIYNTVSNISNSIKNNQSLDFSDIENLKDAINSIPESILSAGLRS